MIKMAVAIYNYWYRGAIDRLVLFLNKPAIRCLGDLHRMYTKICNLLEPIQDRLT